MKKLIVSLFSVVLLTSTFAQDTEKQEEPQTATVTAPAVVHEAETKRTVEEKSIANEPQKSATTTVAEGATERTENKTDSLTTGPLNSSLVIVGGAVVAYFLLVWFLNYASRTPEIAMSITRGLYYIVGLPVVLIFLASRVLKNAISGGASDYQSRLSGMGYSSGGSPNTSTGNNPGSSSAKETVEFQFQSKSGNWSSGDIGWDNSDNCVAHGMRNLAIRIQGNNQATGHIRAKGTKTGRIYDIR